MNKASGGDGIPIELFQILKVDAIKVLHSICQQTYQWPQDWKRSLFIPTQKKDNVKECSNYCKITFISHTNKVMLKIPKRGFSNTCIKSFQIFKLDLAKAEEPEIKLPPYVRSSREFQKKIYFCFIDYTKDFNCVDHRKLWKILRDENTIPPYLPPEKSVCRSRSYS